MTETGNWQLGTVLWLYYITDRKQFPGGPAEQRRRLLDKIAEAVRCGVHFVQLREKDLSARDLEQLARDAVTAIRENSRPGADATKLLINSRADVALAASADGVHLPANDLTPSEAREIWMRSASHGPQPLIGISCHSADDVRRAQADGADFAVFAPVFEKVTSSGKQSGTGLAALRDVCDSVSKKLPVLALGGVTLENARSCVEAGAAGVGGIRLFQDHDVELVVSRLAARSRR